MCVCVFVFVCVCVRSRKEVNGHVFTRTSNNDGTEIIIIKTFNHTYIEEEMMHAYNEEIIAK